VFACGSASLLLAKKFRSCLDVSGLSLISMLEFVILYLVHGAEPFLREYIKYNII